MVNVAVGVQQTHGGFHKHRLAGAAFAYDGKAFPFIDVQTHAANGVKGLAPKGEFHVQILDG